MSNTPSKLTRDQLSEFLPNARAVRAFEQILKQLADLLPLDIKSLQDQITAHLAQSSGVHGTIGTVVGSSDTQTLTNKTINLASNTLIATSAQIAASVTDETGSGALVFATQPSFPSTAGVGGAPASGSGAGLSFPATQSASTDPNTLDDYEEGTCSLTASSSVGSITSSTVQATYTKIGRCVTVTGSASITNNGTGSGFLLISGLPFTSAQPACGIGRELATSGWACSLMLPTSSTQLQVFNYAGIYPVATGSTIYFSVTYSTT
jgi:hypothetical protein